MTPDLEMSLPMTFGLISPPSPKPNPSKRCEMNKERLELLADHIEKLPPEKFDMWQWCGTACCVAGHAISLAGIRPRHKDETPGLAQKWLGLTMDQRTALFSPIGRLGAMSSPPKRAAAVVRHLKDTGKVEWERFA